MGFCVFFFHLRWSSLVRGSGDCFVSSCLMLCLSIFFPFMFWICCCTVEAVCGRCQSACLALLVTCTVWLMECLWWCCMVAQGMPPSGEFSQSAVRNMAAGALCSKDLISMGAPTSLRCCRFVILHHDFGPAADDFCALFSACMVVSSACFSCAMNKSVGRMKML